MLSALQMLCLDVTPVNCYGKQFSHVLYILVLYIKHLFSFSHTTDSLGRQEGCNGQMREDKEGPPGKQRIGGLIYL